MAEDGVDVRVSALARVVQSLLRETASLEASPVRRATLHTASIAIALQQCEDIGPGTSQLSLIYTGMHMPWLAVDCWLRLPPSHLDARAARVDATCMAIELGDVPRIAQCRSSIASSTDRDEVLQLLDDVAAHVQTAHWAWFDRAVAMRARRVAASAAPAADQEGQRLIGLVDLLRRRASSL